MVIEDEVELEVEVEAEVGKADAAQEMTGVLDPDDGVNLRLRLYLRVVVHDTGKGSANVAI